MPAFELRLHRWLCWMRGHQTPLDVELGRIFHFAAFRCRSCGAKWLVALDD